MKKIFTSLFAATAVALTVGAQQLPNNGFEEAWVDCVPWTSAGNTTAEGTTPSSWTISQVIGINGTGKTIVGEQVEGYNSDKAVKVYNSPNSTLPTVTVPGYVTLGTTWSTSVMNKQNDGGTFGGIEFTGRPEKITFMYKFEKKSENDQPANAIVYLWKGTFTQAKVPGNIVILGNPTTVNMVDRDRNILGIATDKGGEVTKTDDAELIAEGKLVITETTSEWTKGEINLTYHSDATPEKMNIIFAANDYFNSTAMVQGNSLTVDDVKCEYASEDNVLKYTGLLHVEMFGGDITEGGQAATLQLTPNADYTECTFLLPNLKLDALGGAELGDIKVDNVKMTRNGGVTDFNGMVKNLSLLGGEIVADADVTGTCDAQGNIDLKISVIWDNNGTPVPIEVTFNGKGKPLSTSAVEAIESDDVNAPAEYFTIQGYKVNGNNLTNGFYIVRKGNKVSKIYVK